MTRDFNFIFILKVLIKLPNKAYTHSLSKVCNLTACGLDCPQICGHICLQPWEMEAKCWEVRAKSDLAVRALQYQPSPPPHPPQHWWFLWHTQKRLKSSAVNATAWHFGHKDLVKTRLFIIIHEKSMGTAIYSFKNFKIYQLENMR
jgi:hypothetical protein